MDQRVPLRPHAPVRAHAVRHGIFVVMVVQAVAPVRRRLALENGQEGAALHLGRRGKSGHRKEGRGVVDVLDHRREARPGLHHAGPADDERHAERFLVHPALVVPAVFAHVEPLVGAVDDDGVLRQPVFIQILQDAPDAVVHRLDAPQVVLQIALVLPAYEVLSLRPGLAEHVVGRNIGRIPRLALGRGHALVFALELRRRGGRQWRSDFEIRTGIHMPADFHFLFGGGGGAAGIVIEEVVGFRHCHVFEQGQITLRRHPGAVGRLVLAHEQEGLVLPAAVEPLQGVVGDEVGDVALVMHLAAGAQEVGIVIIALARQNLPVVETGRIAHQVPLADERGLIARAPQRLGEGPLRTVERLPLVGREAVDVAVLAGKDGGAAGSADGVATEALFEQAALARQPVNVRRQVVFAAEGAEPPVVGADGLQGMVVAEDEQEVRLAACRRGPRGQETAGQSEAHALEKMTSGNRGLLMRHDRPPDCLGVRSAPGAADLKRTKLPTLFAQG